MDPFEQFSPSPIEEGINEGFEDGLIAGRKEGFSEGFREGLLSGKEFGSRLGNSFVLLLQIIKSNENADNISILIESAQRLLVELDGIPLTNEEDPEKEARLAQIESKIKVLTVNFSKKVKCQSINRSASSNKITKKDDLSF